MKDFYFISHDNTEPYFNIASEEYLLKHTDNFYVYLWRNSSAVIVGVNQNTVEEVNLGYTESHGIKVVRRQTGGGAVYHDLGNVCYTVIAPYDQTQDNYRKFTAPVIEYLNSLGVKAEFSGRNDITVDGKKISGNAQTVFKDRIMHHGTLLFNTDTSVLAEALKPNKLKMESKGIKSVRARVTNIYDCLQKKTSAETFFNGLCDFFRKDMREYSFSEVDLKEIDKIVAEKYSKYEWNVGSSPKGKSGFEARFSFGIFKINFDLENGAIINAAITGDFFSLQPVEKFCSELNGTSYVKSEIEKAFSVVNLYIKGADGAEIAEKFFE